MPTPEFVLSLREKIGHDLLWLMGVSGYVEDEQGRVLLGRRSDTGEWAMVYGINEPGEEPADTVAREVKEETGLTLTDYRFRGIVTFVSNQWPTEYMYLYTATGFEGEMIVCDEGDLEWVDHDKITDLPIWEGDKLFLRLLAEEAPFFSLKLEYQGDTLVYAALDGKEIKLQKNEK